jgi:hypothetical protein
VGTVARKTRFAIVALLALTLLVPISGHAASTTYGPPWAMGPQGGDANNYFDRNQDTGQMTVLRVQAAGISGGLGCGGSGGFSNFAVNHPAAGATAVTVAFSDAIVDPYTFIHLSVRDGSSFLGSASVQGPIVHPVLGATSLTLTLPEASTGPIEIWFGIQVTSACPNVDGGTATFTSVAVTSA